MISLSIGSKSISPKVLRIFSTKIPTTNKPLKPSFLKSYSPLFQLDSTLDTTPYKLIAPSTEFTKTNLGEYCQKILHIPPSVLYNLTIQAFADVSHLLRPSHLQQLRNIYDDPDASSNDKFVALELLKNANIAAGKVLPSCQDTGTAIIIGKKGANIHTHTSDERYISQGVYDAYNTLNLRYSQVASTTMFEENNTQTNLPAQIDIIHSTENPDEYSFLFMAKGGGSANKTFLYQQTKALLNPISLKDFLLKKISSIGTSACPPYHLAIVIGGLSAELTLKTVKLASAGYYDTLPTKGDSTGRAYRDLEWEEKIYQMTQKMGVGAQFGGKYFCHDIRVIRLPRHGASCPVGMGVSCSADRQIKGKINDEGVWLEQLEENVGKYLPDVTLESLQSSSEVVSIDLNSLSMNKLRSVLSQYPIKTRLSLSGTIVVMRDIAHAKILQRLKDGHPLPSYVKDHVIYYAGPAKTPEGYASGSFGPTTAGRMDCYLESFMKKGGSFVTLAKGNRSKTVTKVCKTYGGFYLGSIGGPAAILAHNCITNVQVWDFEEEGMEAVWKIKVRNFPAFVVVNDKGEDFFQEWFG